MSLSQEQVKKIAYLARLNVQEEDLGIYARTLSDILDFVEQMDGVDTEGVEPMAHPLELSQRLRSDAPTESDQRAHFQRIAPAVEDGLYLVPKVIE
ncbi:Asp-tRNA(Asn)/Glu-tRNA(Gln) amidotransferase subunit GatC [Ectothiorhodospira lacustris]|uniref:Asp-tRNA(Asn)/Glu-tRNA(Gln) amidotransferase subunit GatC n=1 Tax=Ectothiorhodospira lacustris TaxID=2899127 RepID=UPI001EE88E60|nr:Asp-tRNA(Asn)/Glu-tRNA(Gln) amidotransferase subunit GatC [Ectothiorhodospira lacustris]MCG5500867.1 Asp-tRNA(Asn)/Glu-tRNA(Gln) amidotransferase subunit GatC [Ectothiorhodospira lacustris]MCG5511399.1 Asp-tRNA(Asn)/Glu-tRNA(Gln) amidotransferase subunit GatC [Ectothiorhodospira lacustris]MCG5523200.1 Asp-tRNA(Asn)/Glu-tRNA(Gln) amidotransferase subunit GatC [Ectothiorhodospira lacustris]